MIWIAVIILAIGAIMILFGMYLFMQGFNGLVQIANVDQKGPVSKFFDYIFKAWKIVFNPEEPVENRKMAAGIIFVLFGVVFLLAGGLPTIAALLSGPAPGGSGGSPSTTTPPPTTT